VTQGLTSRRGVETFYADARLALLTRTLTTTPNGYRSNDLRFLIGSILWTQGHTERAVGAWRQMTAPADDLYAEAIRPLRAVLEAQRPDARAIGYILKNQEGRWASFSDDRLKRFGYRADAY
jgi:lipopolysaccharide biosynthesis regulator YciM